MRMMTFVRHLDIQFKAVYIEKKHVEDLVDATGKLSRQLASFVRNNQEFFKSFDSIKVYYDKYFNELFFKNVPPYKISLARQ